MAADAPLTLGTAGHVDHGKTALVRALTGVDTDRLPEEHRRGISVALGYAALELPSGRRLSVVDVPGHERFVRTMVAGATGIDCFLLVVAADDGVMPQTLEHLAVLRALGVDAGVVALTKADLADPAPAAAEVAELVPGAEAVPVSARTGMGLDALRAALERLAAAVASRGAGDAGPQPLRLHVDRAFTVRGAGTVVTGTLWSGVVARGDEIVLLPAGRRARVRRVEVHDAPVDVARAGQRVALNLTGVRREAVGRGDVVVAGAGAPAPTYRLDATLDCAPAARLMVHHGTREVPARAVALGGDAWQLRLEAPLVALAGDRLVLRTITPPDTLGGGVVLDPGPRRRTASTPAAAEPRGSSRVGGVPATRSRLDPAEREVGPAAPPPLTPAALALADRLRDAGLAPPPDAELDADALAALRAHGLAVRLGPALHVHAAALAAVRDHVVARLEADGTLTLARARDELGCSRRVAQLVLERLDADRVTLRRGDGRVLRRRRWS